MELGEETEALVERILCQFCKRKFAPESLTKHSVACERSLRKKRKIFDSSKQRIKGTELAEFLSAVTTKENDALISPVKEKPIMVHKIDNNVEPVPARKSINKRASPIIRSTNYERCLYCDRTFGPKAFDRHIEWCKEQSIRINSKSPATLEAKERLEARIKYRAPSFKSKKSLTREKYSPKPHSPNSLRDTTFIGYVDNDRRISKSSASQLKIRFAGKSKPSKETNFIRQNVLRCSYKPESPKKTRNKIDKELNNLQNKENAHYSEIQNWITSYETRVKQFPQSSKQNTPNSSLTSSMNCDYDPFLLAEQQLKDLLNGIHVNDEPIKAQSTPTQAIKEDRRNKFHNKENTDPVKTISCQTDTASKEGKRFKTSPTSAFDRYLSNESTQKLRAPTPIPDFDYEIERNENFLPYITNNARSVATSSAAVHVVHNMNRYPLISLSNLSLCSSVSIDIAEERRKGCCKNAEMRNDNEPPLVTRSFSTTNDKLNRNLIKKCLKMENFLYGDEVRESSNSGYTNDSYNQDYDEKLEKFNNMLKGENCDLMYSFSEFKNMLQNSYYDNDKYITGSESLSEKHSEKRERGDSLVSKASIDSAYNRNRKSSSGIESELHYEKTSNCDTDALKSTMSLSTDLVDMNYSAVGHPKPSKFCHECGARFPLAIAKFCCECGVRRLVI